MTTDLTTRVRTDLPPVIDLLRITASCIEAAGSYRSFPDIARNMADERLAMAIQDAVRAVQEFLGVDSFEEWRRQPGRSSAQIVEALRGAARACANRLYETSLRAERKPYVASTHGRDPFEVLGVDPNAEDDIPF